MPTIPAYNGPQLRQAGIEGGFQRSEDISSGPMRLAQGLSDVAKAADHISLVNATRAANDVETQVRQAWFEENQGLRKKFSGSEIAGYQPAVNKWWADAPTRFGEGLDARATGLATFNIGRAQDAFKREANAWSTQETLRAATTSSEAAKSQVTQDALTSLSQGNMAALPAAAADIKKKNAEFMAVHNPNATAEEVSQQNIKDLTVLHLNAVSQLNVSSPAAAKSYWDNLDKSDFDAKRIDEVNKMLKVSVANQEGGAYGREVFAKFMDGKKYTEAVPVSDIDKELTKKYGDDPDKLHAARQEADRQTALFNTSQSEYRAASINGVYAQLNSGVPLAIVKRSPEYRNAPAQDQQQIERDVVDRYYAMDERKRAEFDRSRAPAAVTYSDPRVLGSMTEAQVDALRPELGEKNHGVVKHAWQQYQSNQVKLSEAKVDADMFDAVAISNGLDPKPKSDNKEAYARLKYLHDNIEQEIGKQQQSAKRELTRSEKDEVMKGVISREVLTPRSWMFFGGNPVPAATLGPNELSKHSVPVQGLGGKTVEVPFSSVPTLELAKVKQSLARRGLPNDDISAVREWYDIKNPAK